MQRETRVPEEPGESLYDAEGSVYPQPTVVPVDDMDTLEGALQAAIHICRYIGGAVTIAPIRREIAPGSGVYRTTEYVFKWDSFVPPAPAEEPELNGAPAEEPAQAA